MSSASTAKDLMNITYFLTDDGGCSYVRAKLPLTTLGLKGEAKVRQVCKGDDEDKVLMQMAEADAVLIPRIHTPQMLMVAETLQKSYEENGEHFKGKKVVTDFDDNVFNISPLSPHYEEFGTEDSDYILPDGSALPLWKDGKNIDLKANRARLDTVKRALETVDLVTVTTDILADAYRQYNENIKVLPNCVDPVLWKKLPLKRESDEIRIGWAGGSSHYEDWFMIAGVLPEIMAKYPKAKLVLMGHKFEGSLKGINPSQIEYHPWVPIGAYPYKMAILDPDLAVIPLRDTAFNRCKSAIKWIEYAAIEVPAVTSYLSPYKENATEENGVWITDNDPQLWFEGISMLIDDEVARRRIAKAAHKTMLCGFDINLRYKEWLKAYEEVA